MIGWILRIPSMIAIALVRCYQRLISPLIGPQCRFRPTCSEYAVQVIRRDGLLRGGSRAAWRIMRCHPWSSGGNDPP
jgi:uncharacterized protein